MKTYETYAGEHIETAASAMVNLAIESNEDVTADFNGITVTAVAGTKQVGTRQAEARGIVEFYERETARLNAEYLASPEYAKSQADAKARDDARAFALKGALLFAPAEMTLADGRAADWAECVAKNSDPYGAATVQYAELWARIMEGRIANGDTVEGCAEEASQIAGAEGITGFMYGCAVGILAHVWVHGEKLRRWHNLKTQVKDEGERANESGGVLNPAVLCIG